MNKTVVLLLILLLITVLAIETLSKFARKRLV